MTAGLIAASAAVITDASARSWILAIITATSALVLTTTRVHPLVVAEIGARIGLGGIGQV